MERRKLRDESDARSALTAAAASGLSRPAWAAANGVDARSLNAWRLVLARRDARLSAPAPLRLVELVVERPPARPRYRVELEDAIIEVNDDFSAVTLERLLAVVRAC